MDTTTFVSTVTSLIEPVKEGLALFLEPPMVFFVAAGGLVVVLGLAKKLVPVRRK